MHTRNDIERSLQDNDLRYDCLETGNGGWAIVVPELGAKVLAAGVDSENCFWTSKKPQREAWCVGGQRTWLAPEIGSTGFFGTSTKNWHVPPEIDPGSYRRIAASSGDLSFRSAFTINRLDGLRYSLYIVRAMRTETIQEGNASPGLRIRVNNQLINQMDRDLDKEVGLWSILQIPSDVTGTFLIPLNKPSLRHKISEQPYRLYFGDLPVDWVSVTPTLLSIKARAGKWYKIGIPPAAATGTVGFLRPSYLDKQYILTVLRCALEPSARYLDKPPFQEVTGGDVLQCYNSPDAQNLNFCELEAHAPAVRLSPGAKQTSAVEVLLFKDGSESILNLVANLVSPEINPGRLFID